MTAKPQTRADQLFWFFMHREGVWVDTYQLEKIGGRCAWRTRVSDARRRARVLKREIVNRQRRKRIGKRQWVVSQYCCCRQKDVQKVKQAA